MIHDMGEVRSAMETGNWSKIVFDDYIAHYLLDHKRYSEVSFLLQHMELRREIQKCEIWKEFPKYGDVRIRTTDDNLERFFVNSRSRAIEVQGTFCPDNINDKQFLEVDGWGYFIKRKTIPFRSWMLGLNCESLLRSPNADVYHNIFLKDNGDNYLRFIGGEDYDEDGEGGRFFAFFNNHILKDFVENYEVSDDFRKTRDTILKILVETIRESHIDNQINYKGW